MVGTPGTIRRSRLDGLLDGVGLLLLGWMVALWHLGSVDAPTWPRVSADFTELPLRSELTILVIVLTVPLVAVVLASFGRPPTRLRLLAAVPLLSGLVAVAVWRFLTGFVGGLPDGSPSSVVLHAGFWDGSAATLGLAATALLVIREYRLTRRLVIIATVAVIISVAATLGIATFEFTHVFQIEDRDQAILFLGLWSPPLLIALLGLAMAPAWLRELWRGDLRGAAALVLWGSVICAGAVVPQYLLLELQDGPGVVALSQRGVLVDGLDWAQGAFVVAAAVLITPVVRAYPTRNRHVQDAILGGPLAVLALLLIARLAGELIAYRLLLENASIRWSYPNEQLILLLGLVGAAVMLWVAIRPRERSAPLAMLGATLLIAAPVLLYLVPRAINQEEYRYAPLGSLGPMTQPFSLWEGDSFAVIFVLPILLLALLTRPGTRPPQATPEVVEVEL